MAVFPSYLIHTDLSIIKMIALQETDSLRTLFASVFLVASPQQVAPCLQRTPTLEIKARVVIDFLAKMTMLLLLAHLATCLWIRAVGDEAADIFRIYTTALYFLITTASTTGYGDVTVDKRLAFDDSWQYVYATLVILFALNYFVVFIAYNKALIEDLNLQESIKAQALEAVEDWFAVRNQTAGAKITWDFEKLVKGYHFFLVNKDLVSKLTYGDYYDKLPHWVQAKIQRYIVNDLISAFEIFKAMPANVAAQIALQYTSLQ